MKYTALRRAFERVGNIYATHKLIAWIAIDIAIVYLAGWATIKTVEQIIYWSIGK